MGLFDLIEQPDEEQKEPIEQPIEPAKESSLFNLIEQPTTNIQQGLEQPKMSLADRFMTSFKAATPIGLASKAKEMLPEPIERGVENVQRGAMALAPRLAKTPAGLAKSFAEQEKPLAERLTETFLPMGQIQHKLAPVIEGLTDKILPQKEKPKSMYERSQFDKKIIEISDKIIKKTQEWSNNKNLQQIGDKPMDKFMYGLGSGLASFGAAAGSTLATGGNPAIAALLFGSMQYSDTYLKSREKDKSVEKSLDAALLAGAAEGGLEFVGLDLFFNKIGKQAVKQGGKKITKWFSNVVLRSLTEGSQEASQEIAGAAIGKAFDIEDRKTQQILNDVGFSALIGGVIGGGSSMVLDTAKNIGLEQKLLEAGVPPKDVENVIVTTQQKINEEFKDIKVSKEEIQERKKEIEKQKKFMTDQVQLLKEADVAKEDLQGFILDRDFGSPKLRELITKYETGEVETRDDILDSIKDNYRQYKKKISKIKPEQIEQPKTEKPKTLAERLIAEQEAKKEEPLIKEAKKYKTAEEFVKAQTNAVRQGAIDKNGAYFSTEGTSTYFDLENTRALKYNISDAKLVQSGTPEMRAVLENAKKLKNTPEELQRINDALKADNSADNFVDYMLFDEVPSIKKSAEQLKYDGVKIWENDDIADPSSVFIWNTNIIKTKSQLTDIWNKANQKAKEVKVPIDLKQKVKETAESLRDKEIQEYEFSKQDDILNKIKEKGGLDIKFFKGKEEVKDIPQYVRMQTFKKGGLDLDDMAARLNIGEQELLQQLKDYEPVSKPKGTETFYEDAKDIIKQEIGEDEYNRLEKQQGKILTQQEVKEMKPVKAYRTGEKIGRTQERNKLTMKINSKKASVEQIKKALTDYASKHLAFEDKGKLLVKVRDVKTKAGLQKAIDLVDEIEEKAQRGEAINSLKKTIKKIDIKKLRPEYKKEIMGLIDSVDLVNRRDKTIESLNNTLKFLEENEDNNIPEERLRQLRILEKKKIKDLTLDDIDLLHNSIKHAKHLMDIKNKMLLGNKYREFAEIKNEAVNNIKKRKKINEESDIISETDKPEKEGIFKKFFKVFSLNPELITQKLDNKDNGIIQKILYRDLDVAETRRIEYVNEAYKEIKEKIDFDFETYSSLFIPKESKAKQKLGIQKSIDWQNLELPSGRKIKLSKGSRIALYLDSLNKKNLRHVLEGGFSFHENQARINKLTSEDLEYIIGTMTKEEYKIGDAIYNYLNTTQKKKLNEVSAELNGFDVAVEDNYFPIATNSLARVQDKLSKSPQAKFIRKTLEGRGFLKERTNANTPIILEDAFLALTKSIKQSAAYYAYAKPLRNARSLLGDPDFKTSVIKYYGKSYLKDLNNYIDGVEGNSANISGIEKITLDLINKFDLAILGLNPWTMLKQTISYWGSATEMKFKYLINARTLMPASKKIISKWSPQLGERFKGHVTREMGEVSQAGEVRSRWLDKSPLSQQVMKGIAEFDYQAIGRIWNAVSYEIDDTTDLKGDARMKAIAARAEEVVRRTQPTFSLKDRSTIGRERALFVRLATKYTSQLNKNFIMINRAFEKYRVSNHTSADKVELIKSISVVTVLMNSLLLGINKLRDLAYGRKSKKGKNKYMLLFLDLLEANLNAVYFVGNAFTTIKNKYIYGKWSDFGTKNVLESASETSWEAMVDLVNAIDQAMSKERYASGSKRGQYKWKNTTKSFLNNTLSVASKFKGIPYENLVRIYKIFNRKKKTKRRRVY